VQLAQACSIKRKSCVVCKGGVPDDRNEDRSWSKLPVPGYPHVEAGYKINAGWH